MHKPIIVQPHEVFENIKKRKPKRSKVLGDLPPTIKKELGFEIVGPVANIFNSTNHPVQQTFAMKFYVFYKMKTWYVPKFTKGG